MKWNPPISVMLNRLDHEATNAKYEDIPDMIRSLDWLDVRVMALRQRYQGVDTDMDGNPSR